LRWYLVAIFAYVLIVIQTTLFDTGLLAFKVFDAQIRPDLLLLLAIFIAMRASPVETFVAGWCLGLVEDLTVHQGPIGVAALLFAAVACAAGFFREALAAERILVQVPLALAVVFVVRVPQQMLLLWLGGGSVDIPHTLVRAAGDGAYSALLAPYLFWVLARTAARQRRL
jgi:rod shape-determining protein MreD